MVRLMLMAIVASDVIRDSRIASIAKFAEVGYRRIFCRSVSSARWRLADTN